jgi:hypothetical protein
MVAVSTNSKDVLHHKNLCLQTTTQIVYETLKIITKNRCIDVSSSNTVGLRQAKGKI